MTLSELINIWGNRANLAKAIGEGDTTVRNWFNRGSMPFRADDEIIRAAAVKGHLVTPADLHEIRREIMRAKGGPKGAVRSHVRANGHGSVNRKGSAAA